MGAAKVKLPTPPPISNLKGGYMPKYIKLNALFKALEQIEEVAAWLSTTIPETIQTNSQKVFDKQLVSQIGSDIER